MNTPLTHLLRNCLFYHIPLSAYARLEQESSLSPACQAELNWQRRLALVRHVCSVIPFYRRKYSQAGIEAADIRTEDDFARLPLLTKAEVREFSAEMIAPHESLSVLNSGATGGSTGEPVRFYYDPIIPNALLGWPAVSQLGIALSDSAGVVGRGVPTKWKQKLHDFCFFPQKIAYLDAARPIDNSEMRIFAETLIRIRAKYIRGYVGGIMQFAEFCQLHQIQIPSLRLIWTSSAPLPEFQRQMLQQTFGCPAYTQYGCCEIPWLAMECTRQCGLHLFPTLRHLEITDESGKLMKPGNIGNVVVTNLLDKRFPLIRYVNGDRSSFRNGQCSCGNPAPLIDYIHGRVSDCLQLSDGSILFGDYLTTVFDRYPQAVKAFQFRQYTDGRIRFSLVKNSHYPYATQEIERVVSDFRAQVAERNPIDVVFCENIVADRGKSRFIIRER